MQPEFPAMRKGSLSELTIEKVTLAFTPESASVALTQPTWSPISADSFTVKLVGPTITGGLSLMSMILMVMSEVLHIIGVPWSQAVMVSTYMQYCS